MKLLIDKDGHVVVRNGMPVYVKDDGTEIEFDAPGTQVSIARLNSEAKERRTALEAANEKLKAVEGLDPIKAREALETVSKLDGKKLLDAGKVDELTAQINKGWQEKLDASETKAKGLEGQLHESIIGGSFARSKFIADKMAIPPDLVQSFFGKSFKLENGKIIATNQHGEVIRSKSNPAEVAEFEEALEQVVAGYSQKDSIMKATQGSGGGTNKGGAGGGAGGAKTMPRTQFDALDTMAQGAFVRGGGKPVD